MMGLVIGVFGFKPAGQFTNVVNRRLPGKRSIGSMTLRELNHFHINLKKGVFAKNLELDGNLHIKTHFLPNTYMVRMVHTNNFYEISLQISDPNIEFSTKTDIFEKWPCPIFLEMRLLAKKCPCEVPPQQNKGCKHIPAYSRPKLYLKIYVFI